MVANVTDKRRKNRKARPLDEAGLRDLALSYAARYATTAAKLESYLQRKIRERGLAEQDEPLDAPQLVNTIVERLVELRYVDDKAYAKARSGSLLRRGYGKRRVNEALRHAGVDEHTREDVAPSAPIAREAAITLARKKRFGPFTKSVHFDDGDDRPRLDPAIRQKQIAAMLRAGHGFDLAKIVVDAESEESLEEWLLEAIEEAREEGGA